MATFVCSRVTLRTLLKLPRCAGGLTARSFLRVSAPQENHNFITRRLVMKRTIALLFLSMFCLATAMQAQAQAPKPDPELKKLHVWVGRWTLEGEFKPGPLGPGGKWTGEDNCRMILGGFFYQCQLSGKVAEADMRILAISVYDPANKNFPSGFYFGDGGRFSGVLTNTGNTWAYAGQLATAGKQYQYKGTFVLAPDLASATHKAEISSDGQTWAPWAEAKFTKVQPAAKK